MKGIYLLTNPGRPCISGDASLEMSLPKPLLFFQCLKETFSLLLWEVELPGEGELRAGGSLQSSWSSWSTLVPHGESLTWRCGAPAGWCQSPVSSSLHLAEPFCSHRAFTRRKSSLKSGPALK